MREIIVEFSRLESEFWFLGIEESWGIERKKKKEN
jgi:hypothetical protein